jgi:hypothetical protein
MIGHENEFTANNHRMRMVKHGYRQEVLNVVLAQILQDRGVISAPEKVIKQVFRKMPDVMVNFMGLRTVIEGEVEDQPGAKERALESAAKRVEDGIAHIGVAIIYPAFLRQLDLGHLKPQMAECQYEIAVVSESVYAERAYNAGDVNYLAEILRKTFDQLVKEDVVAQAVALLDSSIDKVAAAVQHCPGFVPKAALALGIRALPARKKPKQGEQE